MFAYLPASNLYSRRRPSAYPASRVYGQRPQYLSALAEMRAAEARYLAELARDEDAFLGDDLFDDYRVPYYDERPYRRNFARRDPYAGELSLYDDEFADVFSFPVRRGLARQREEEHLHAAHLRQLAKNRAQRYYADLLQSLERQSGQQISGQPCDVGLDKTANPFVCHPRRDASPYSCHQRVSSSVIPLSPLSDHLPQKNPLNGCPVTFSIHTLPSSDKPQRTQLNTQPSEAGPSAPDVPATSVTQAAKAPRQDTPHADFRNVETLLKSFLGAVAQRAPSQSAPTATSTQTPPVAQSLKEQLESRLKHDPDVEIRDTIQAIWASLFTPSPAAPADPAPATDAKGKRKEKSVSFETPKVDGTSKDVASALDTVRSIEASFFALESDFVFPATLDLNTDVLSNPSSPNDTDASSVASFERKLAYSARNAPVRYYQHALTGLLAQLDAVESHGSEEVRERRKVVVDRVESALEDVEKKIEIRLAAPTATAPVAAVEQDQVADVASGTTLPSEPLVTVSDADSLAEESAEAKPASLSEATESTLSIPLSEGTTASEETLVGTVVGHVIQLMPSESDSSLSSDSIIEPTEESIPSVSLTAESAPADAAASSPLPPPIHVDTSPATDTDTTTPFLLHVAIEPPSLSKPVREDQTTSASDGEELVVVEEDAVDDAGSDKDAWSEVEA
jgi:BAG domain